MKYILSNTKLPHAMLHVNNETEQLNNCWCGDCFKLNHGYQELKTRRSERVRERRRASKRARGEEERKRDRFGKETNKTGRKEGRYREEKARARTHSEDSAARKRDSNE